MEFIIGHKNQELRGAVIGDKRWIIGSSVGRAVGLKPPKSFAKALIKKEPLQAWPDSFVADGFGVNSKQVLYAIERRVLSCSLSAYVVAHMRISEDSVSIFQFLLKLHELGFDKPISKMPTEKFTSAAQSVGIKVKP